MEGAGVPVIIGSNDSSEPRGGKYLNSDVLRVRLFVMCLSSHSLCSKKKHIVLQSSPSTLEFHPVGFSSVEFVYVSRKDGLGLTLVLYSAKEFCLIVIYTMLLMLTILLWLSDTGDDF